MSTTLKLAIWIALLSPLWTAALAVLVVMACEVIDGWRYRRVLAKWRERRAARGIYHDTICLIDGKAP